jgi:cytochrome P450
MALLAGLTSSRFFDTWSSTFTSILCRNTQDRDYAQLHTWHGHTLRSPVYTTTSCTNSIPSQVRDEKKGEVKISREDIEANMTLLIFAGSEMTSTAMVAIVYE